MNIKDAKEEIKNAVRAYFTKDKFGNYVIPLEKQRPVFLMGPPGIGKTAIMEQIASELDVGLVSYSMTHHTRQSALGLPFIEKKTYKGKEYSISEYTMSEIIASVYDMMEETGHDEGILFLDEINCVSETLAPAMLQFLQYKIFGKHRVPEGWIVVTAGNPPEYNNSVREFDIVTWDRLKRIDIEPDYEVWKEYALNTEVHPAVTTYLDIKRDDFYKIETTVDGKRFVTARGWSDLSEMIKLYEQNDIPVRERLVSQYLQDAKTARDFAVYYDLFNKYKSDYQIEDILDGREANIIKERAKKAKFDERLSIMGLLINGVSAYINEVCTAEKVLTDLVVCLKNVHMDLMKPGADAAASIARQAELKEKALAIGIKSSSMSHEMQNVCHEVVTALNNEMKIIEEQHPGNGTEAFAILKKDFDTKTASLKKLSEKTKKKLSGCFKFCDEVFGDGQEMLILVTELTISSSGAHFIGRYGCEEYFKHNKELLFYERQKEIISELDELKLE